MYTYSGWDYCKTKCPAGRACLVNDNCVDGFCSNGVCQVCGVSGSVTSSPGSGTSSPAAASATTSASSIDASTANEKIFGFDQKIVYGFGFGGAAFLLIMVTVVIIRCRKDSTKFRKPAKFELGYI